MPASSKRAALASVQASLTHPPKRSSATATSPAVFRGFYQLFRASLMPVWHATAKVLAGVPERAVPWLVLAGLMVYDDLHNCSLRLWHLELPLPFGVYGCGVAGVTACESATLLCHDMFAHFTAPLPPPPSLYALSRGVVGRATCAARHRSGGSFYRSWAFVRSADVLYMER